MQMIEGQGGEECNVCTSNPWLLQSMVNVSMVTFKNQDDITWSCLKKMSPCWCSARSSTALQSRSIEAPLDGSFKTEERSRSNDLARRSTTSRSRMKGSDCSACEQTLSKLVPRLNNSWSNCAVRSHCTGTNQEIIYCCRETRRLALEWTRLVQVNDINL